MSRKSFRCMLNLCQINVGNSPTVDWLIKIFKYRCLVRESMRQSFFLSYGLDHFQQIVSMLGVALEWYSLLLQSRRFCLRQDPCKYLFWWAGNLLLRWGWMPVGHSYMRRFGVLSFLQVWQSPQMPCENWSKLWTVTSPSSITATRPCPATM